jgi:hypothetical protein
MKTIYWFIFLFVLYSCQEPKTEVGGIIFTFDDQYVDEWYNFREQFQKYNVKATFFISRPQLLNPEQIDKLLQLYDDGHEIGCHGLNHRNSLDFKDSVSSYYHSEVKPAEEILNGLGFEVYSFAYPFGTSTDLIDKDLNSYIPYLRKATYNMKDTTIDVYDEIFANSISHNLVNSMGIDQNYRISLQNLETGIKRAIKNNEVLVLHAHQIDTIHGNYAIDPGFLEEIFQLCHSYHIKSLRVCDLESFFEND